MAFDCYQINNLMIVFAQHEVRNECYQIFYEVIR